MIVCCATLLVAVAAGAARPAAGMKSEDLAIVAMHNYAACIVERTPRGAEKILAMNPNSAGYRNAVQRFAQGHDDCASNNRLQFNELLFTGGLAEHLLTSRPGLGPIASLLAFDPANPAIEARDEVEVTALCIVRQNPEPVAALFATEPASDAEDRAERALGASLVACVKAGQTIRLNRPALRAMLALAGWRIVEARDPGKNR